MSVLELIVSSLAALGGALVGGYFTLRGADKQHRHNLALKKAEHDRKVDGILRAIKYELEILGRMYASEAGRALGSLKHGDPFMAHFSLTQQYFIVYPNNTGLVAQLDDPELCKAIVVTYNKANLLIDLFRINNWYIERRAECLKLAATLNDQSYIEAGNNLLGFQCRHAAALRAAHDDLAKDTDRLLAQIGNYLQRRQSSFQTD